MSLHLVLPAAGIGKRFREEGFEMAKPLIPVHGIPMILWVLANFPIEKFTRIWIITQKKDRIPENLVPFLGLAANKVTFVELEGITDGPACTLEIALEQMDNNDSVISANTDQYVFDELDSFVNSLMNRDFAGSVLTMTASGRAWSYVGRDLDGSVSRIVEKIQISNEATVGIYGWSRVFHAKDSIKEMMSVNDRVNKEFYVGPSYNYLISKNFKIDSKHVGQHGTSVHGLGVPIDLQNFLARPDTLKLAEHCRKILGI